MEVCLQALDGTVGPTMHTLALKQPAQLLEHGDLLVHVAGELRLDERLVGVDNLLPHRRRLFGGRPGDGRSDGRGSGCGEHG